MAETTRSRVESRGCKKQPSKSKKYQQFEATLVKSSVRKTKAIKLSFDKR